jgi:hypothetical protein
MVHHIGIMQELAYRRNAGTSWKEESRKPIKRMLKRAQKHKTEENEMMRMPGIVSTDKAAPYGENYQV